MVGVPHSVKFTPLYQNFFRVFRDPVKEAVQVAVGRRLRREETFMKLDVDRAAFFSVGHFIGGINVLLRDGKAHTPGEHKLMAQGKLLCRDPDVLIAGNTKVRVRINVPANDALDHAGL